MTIAALLMNTYKACINKNFSSTEEINEGDYADGELRLNID